MRRLKDLTTYIIRNGKRKYFRGTESKKYKVPKGSNVVLVKSKTKGIRKAIYR
jgi:hypothetical protein